ncbi:hypothetical protein AWC05_19005 [Mycobacterium florentinum]|uniref:Uncharacterized protein n=1 Tax=Mycobacterium florentinum TaxID=292462 RepID=A0A1X1UAK1_MYCFL|nr:hypothetical protein [Mycobacterium florentinum]MCV7407989.1 hypothetical protein [Mycobacterium florentinum]ORV53816.1 hypothetical protein AWC05_19005 [Mycobacterium florentinum]BBX77380.1 hypothetical protein MFLOJ_11670 [Mycobacterium florentinum]
MKMSGAEMREILESLQRDWPPLEEARTTRERFVATSIKTAIVMLDVSGPGLGGVTGSAALPRAVRDKALAVAVANYELVRRLIDQESVSNKAFYDHVIREVAILAEQGAEVSQMIAKAIEQ